MLEKHGNLELTPGEIEAILLGEVPTRIRENWGDLTLEDLRRIINTQTEQGENQWM